MNHSKDLKHYPYLQSVANQSFTHERAIKSIMFEIDFLNRSRNKILHTSTQSERTAMEWTLDRAKARVNAKLDLLEDMLILSWHEVETIKYLLKLK